VYSFRHVVGLYLMPIPTGYRSMKNLLIVLFCLIFSMVSLEYFTTPYGWIFLSWFLTLVYFTIVSKNKVVKLICLNVGVAAFTLGLFEIYLWGSNIVEESQRPLRRFSQPLFRRNDALGYTHPIKRVITDTRQYRGRQLYEAVYTLDDYGLRISPPYRADNHDFVLFFGGSFTFGTGVNDDETLPYQAGIKLDKRFQIHNFGVGGYGPHQMLSLLEHGIVDNIIDCTPKYAIYQAIYGHIERSAGLALWDKHGPKYILHGDGSVTFAGNFDDDKSKIRNQLNKSLIYQNIWGNRRTINEKDINLFLGIVARSRNIIETRYPECEFNVIIWDSNSPKQSETVWEGLSAIGIRVHRVSNIIPDLYQNQTMYRIAPPYEPHPNLRTYELLADYVVSEIID